MSISLTGRYRTLGGATAAFRTEPARRVKILLEDDGSFAGHLLDGDPNTIEITRSQVDGRQIRHRYVRTGLSCAGYRIYVLTEVTGDDVERFMATLGKQKSEEWSGADFEDATGWLGAHRAGRSDRGLGRRKYIRRAS